MVTTDRNHRLAHASSPARRPLRSLAALVCATAAVLATACCATPAPAAPPGTAATADLPPGGVAGVRVPILTWTDAGDGYQQATAEVPYDYTRPRGRTLGLHLVRLLATEPAHRMGTLFVNPGGPGQPADAFVRTLGPALLPAEVLARYDLVGVDPRGTGGSRSVRCTDSPDELQTLPYATEQAFPTEPTEQAEAVDQITRYALQCRARNGDLLDHVGTLASARDLDVLRAAVGDARINLLGFSYGTFLGQVIANTFPDRTGALVLDGVVNPAWATGARGTISWIRENSDVGGWETLQRFFRLCADAGPQRCAFAADGDPAQTFARLADRLRTTPLRVAPAGRPPRSLDYDELVIYTNVLLGSAPAWPVLGELLHAASTGDAQAVSLVLDRVPPPPAVYFDANTAVTCGDTDNPGDPGAYGAVGRQRDATVASYAGSLWAFRALPCASWLGRSTERYTGPWTARTSTPVLLLNTRYDPATPYRNAVLVHDLLPNSALLTVDGVGHGALLLSSCAQDATAQYLLTAALPPPGTVCAQDLGPFDKPPA
jgi:pimeloyl-ACP methyl ester carboxylesterase